MKSGFSKIRTLFAGTIVFVLFGFISLTGFKGNDKDFEIVKNLDIFYSLMKELDVYYVDEIDPGKMIKNSLDRMLKDLDPYTVLISENQIEDYRIQSTGNYGGLGFTTQKIDGKIFIADIIQNSPADIAKLHIGDELLEVEGKDIRSKSTEEIGILIKGNPKTAVSIKVMDLKSASERTLALIRQNIQLANVSYFGKVGKSTGYIKLSNFMEKAAADVKKAFIELKEKEKIESLVLDLRGNPGGLLVEAVSLVNLFVPKGELIVSTKGKINDWNKNFLTMENPVDLNIPVIVLIDRMSASASEIVSGALQDLDRAVIVGEKSYGKGLVQITLMLSYNTQFKVTTAKYYIPSGRCIQVLDYSHRNVDGSVGKVPDSLKTEFKTRNSRKVFDGGGVLPDVSVNDLEQNYFVKELISSNLFFKFGNEFFKKNDSIADVLSYSLPENVLNDFERKLNGDDMKLDSETCRKFKEFKDLLIKENLNKNLDQYITQIEKAIEPNKALEFSKNKELIKLLIQKEIVKRYYYEKGMVQNSLESDQLILKSLEVFSEIENYSKILNKK